ncbi:Transcriptional regulator, AraC family protein [Pseudomonas fluorescens]|uniref:Transcriptional regulator, AraC family protein n=1 Tax=Pseudomonas fluorescens TaxID=294 RepID=A0A379I968_PSEFL|nr:AraC family transcriptional regulator [Pseudomonas fluorescens]AIG05025.1 AraC family transcriptional regulator [Pseudomonas fluorescens]SUD29369.1 Transcriptional regulator, AraC family protein [Pseudomonas fluorescens]
MDALSELMHHLHLRTRVFHRSTHCGRWDVDADYEQKAMFHLVASGRCLLRTTGVAADTTLQAGDAVIFTSPCDHVLMSMPDAQASDVTLLLCGYFEFDSPLAAVLLASLPASLLLPGPSTGGQGNLGTPGSLLGLIVAEAQNEAPGASVMMEKLSDALFMYAVRQCLADGSIQSGLLLGLSDPRIGTALLAMHQHPAQPWTVATLAERGHLSRAAFARRFSACVGMSPLEYLTRVRMQVARTAITERRAAVSEAAALAGYATEAAFNRAFKRMHGYPPGALKPLRLLA